MSRALRCTVPTGSGVHTNAHLAVQASLNGEDEAAVPALSIPLRDRLLNRSLNGFAAISVMLANISVGFTKAVSLCMAVTVQQESRGRLGSVWPMTREDSNEKAL
jgi:hypothetical protein